MNEFGIALLWCAGQVTLLAIVTTVLSFVVRRRSPVAGMWVTLTGLTLVVMLSLLAISPWPSWWSRTSGEPEAATVVVEAPLPESEIREDGAVESVATETVNIAAPAGPTLSEFWNVLQAEMARAESPVPSERRWWPTILVGIFVAGVTFGLIQVLGGLLAVRRIRRRSRPVFDRKLHELLDVLQAELGSRQTIALQESPDVMTAATIGCRHPVILLPVQWRQWDDQQRRVVLAHELAHIHHGDYLTGVFAQLTLALHFYHPLVHWLVRRLRLEQELAADAEASAVAGGQRSYLVTLAEMALAQNEHPVGWAARAFLPTRRMFLRRIEMLRDMQNVSTSLSPMRRWIPASLLVVAALAIAGLRSPGDTGPVALAAEPDTPAATASVEEDALKYFTARGGFVIVARPAAVVESSPETAELMKVLWDFSVPPEKLELVAMNPPAGPRGKGLLPGGTNRLLLRTTEAHDWTEFVHSLAARQHLPNSVGKVRVVNGKTFHVLGETAYFQPDDRTIIIDGPEQLEAALRDGEKPGSLLTNDHWKQIASGPLAIAVDSKVLRNMIAMDAPPGSPAAAFATMVAPLAPIWQDTESLYLGVNQSKQLTLRGVGVTGNEASAKRVEETAAAGLVLAKNMVRDVPREILSRDPLVGVMVQVARLLLEAAEVERQDLTVSVEVRVAVDNLPVRNIATSLKAARAAATTVQSRNNMKQLALAFHNYHDVHGHFPQAQNTTYGLGKTSQHPHSWRVALLPYFEQSALYEQYHFEEPWDSEHNLKVAASMPQVFRHPNAPEGTTHSSYYALNGDVTVFPSDKPVGIREVTDGTSNTILLVEAKRPIPWTKPADIPYDADKPLPELDGYSSPDLTAAFVDGSVRTLKSVDEKKLRAYLSRDGREIIPN